MKINNKIERPIGSGTNCYQIEIEFDSTIYHFLFLENDKKQETEIFILDEANGWRKPLLQNRNEHYIYDQMYTFNYISFKFNVENLK